MLKIYQVQVNIVLLLSICVALIVFGLDQLSKFFILDALTYKQSISVLPCLNFTLAHNHGAAFGIFANQGGWQRWLFVGIAVFISVVILFWSTRLTIKDRLETISLGLILGGAWGNLLDRMRFGHVIDFLDFYVGNWHWYTFNIADAAICVGAALLMYTSFKRTD